MKTRLIFGSALAVILLVIVGGLARASTSGQILLGYSVGDDWEPAIAADRNGHTYVLITHYGGVPGCSTCPSPTIMLQIRNNSTGTWSAPKTLTTGNYGSGQFDPQIVVDPVNGQTVYAAWLQNNKSNVMVSKSTDYGQTWSIPVVADNTNAGTDKPELAVRGDKVYVGYNKAQKVYVAVSNDGGQTFTSYQVRQNSQFGWSLASSANVASNGAVYLSWAGYTQNGQAKGPVYLYMSKSTDGGQTWSNTLINVSAAPQTCPSSYKCGFAYLSAQLVLTLDSSNILYGLYNSGTVNGGAERMYFVKSVDGGNIWSSPIDVSSAPQGAYHAFPAITSSGAAGDIRIAWMDQRNNPQWNVYYRSSTNGGSSFSSETTLSSYVPGFSYLTSSGFTIPYGDYFQLAVDPLSNTHAAWGEGPSYTGPGNVWYALTTP